MTIIDAFSTLAPHHPIHEPGETRYLLAPPLNGDSAAIAALRREYAERPRAAGGLYPVMSADRTNLVAELGYDWWCGLILRQEAHGGSLTDDETLVRLALPEAADRPLVIDCGYEDFSRPEHLARFLEAIPARPVMLTHGGQLNISGLHLAAAEALFKQYPQTLFETSGIYRQDFLERMVAELGSARVLYGSGFPLMDEALEIERVRQLPDAPARDAILSDNARRVFAL